MSATLFRRTLLSAMVAVVSLAARANAATTITTFDNFLSDDLYPSWSLPNTVSGPTSYSVTATGYGSNYKYIGFPEILGAGNTHIELTVNLSGPPAADGHLGPLIDIIDGDGTRYSYRWYGQALGSHVLTSPVESPFAVVAVGSAPGLNLNTLTHMHMQLDPGGFGTQGAYTVEWQNLALTVPEPNTMALLAGSSILLLRLRRKNQK